MSVNSSDLIFDLSCLQGQIADVGISLQGLETQRLLNKELYQDNSSSSDIKDAKKYIHDLTSFLKLIGSNDNTQKLNQGLSTFYISEFLYNAMLTLNKFVNEAEYDNNFDIKATGGVRPFNKTFSQNLYRLIKRENMIQTKFDKMDLNEQPIINFEKKVTNSFDIKTREDLLNQKIFANFTDNSFNSPLFESVYTNSYQVVIPTTFMTSHEDFGNNMRKLITDLYKEYYYYEIVDIQKRLNKLDGNTTNLDTNLRIMLQEVRNAFTREIYSPVTDISTEFPLSNIITELNDFINDIDTTHISSYDDSLKLFNSSDSHKIGLYQFIEEKSHMLNQTGNAYHYALELSKRIQRISNYMNKKTDNSLGDNPHFDNISEFTEDACIKGIDEALAILSNLTNDLRLTTGDNMSDCSFAVITNKSFADALTDIEDIYHNFKNYAEDNSNGIFNNRYETDFNTNQLDSLGIINVLKNANLLHYGQTSLPGNSLDFVYNGNEVSNYTAYTENYKTQTYYHNTKVSRYENEYLYRTFSLIVIKIAIALAVLYIFRNIQAYNHYESQKENSTKSLRSAKDNEIERLLSRKIPNDLTITDYTTVTHLRKELEKMKMQLREDTTEKRTFVLPNGTDVTFEVEDDKQISINDSLYVCYKTILDFMNNQAEEGNKLTNSNFISNTFARLYPFTKSMLYQYDEYFSVNNFSDYNDSNDSGSSEIKFGTILNGLNYVAQSVVRSKCEDYEIGDLEKMLTKIIYLCTCLTVNWSDLDEIATPTIHHIEVTGCPLYGLIDFDHTSEHGLYVNKEITMSESNTTQGVLPVFKTTILGFIYGEMKKIVNSSLPLVVKYVYWLSLYCINSYFNHIIKKDITKVVESITN